MSSTSNPPVDGILCIRSGRRAATAVTVRHVAGDCLDARDDPRYQPMVMLVLNFGRTDDDKDVCALLSREAAAELARRLQGAAEPT